jgi:MFS family permease
MTRRLMLMRALRSIGQGVLVVDFSLYLHALNWSGTAIGLLLSATGLFGAVLSLFVGVTSDRLRRKPFLFIYETIALLVSIAVLISANPIVISVAGILGGFGRGANGAAGPFSPAEQAWLAEEVPPERRGRVYSLNTALGFFGMGLGAILAVLPSVWGSLLKGPLAYRPLFLFVSLASIGNLILISRSYEHYQGPQPITNVQEKVEADSLNKKENSILVQLVSVNAFNGIAIGLTGPLISYWFALRFQVGPASIAPVLAATFVITGISSLLTGRLSERVGIIKSIVWPRVVGLVLLILMPIAPFYWLASLFYLLRSAFNRGTAGSRQALTIGLVREQRRGLATSLNAVSNQVPQSVGPSVAGILLDVGQFTLPFYIAAVFQGVYLVAYNRLFRSYDVNP